MVIRGKYKLKNRKPFCLWKDKEVGIASGYFAGKRFAETNGDEYITEVSGSSFGWYDSQGNYYKEAKWFMSRPSEVTILKALDENPSLAKLALNMELIETTGEFFINKEDTERAWMN